MGQSNIDKICYSKTAYSTEMEALSVILQMGYFKLTKGKRIFKMAPLHHHFELKGVAEPKVIVRFWIVGIILMLLALSTLKIR